jgi:glycosyltransferase involved in cell wall biosynthesis
VPLVSIVIPAHNEAAVIGHNLRRLLDGTTPGEFDVIVVANACGDRTAEVAAATGVRVLETPIPGKVPALRLGDDACRTFPRIYLDADVELTAESVRALVRACARPGVLACAPVPELDLAQVDRLARRVHRVHDRLIAPTRALAGVGVYVLTEAGHDRVFPMPDVIADDGWVHASFAPTERVVVSEARSVVRPARTVAAHLNRRVRVRRGNRQLAALKSPGAAAAEGRPGLGSLARLVRRREVGPVDAACYLSVLVVDRALSRIRRDKGGWGSDLSTRSALSAD